jgi:hypothetical protein
MAKKPIYTCREYREEMMLLGLKKRLEDNELSDEERRAIVEEIRKLESAMGLD